MKLRKKPVKGMKEILPAEMEIRDYVENQIKETYKTFGFTPMETPCVEHIENLLNRQGGDNEKLIYKILKRGEKIKLEEAVSENDLVDSALRYDLTVPLCRYYAEHSGELPTPFKALQIGNVWRADQPQRGRYRQFMQCDIDILGEANPLAEIELITAMATLLNKLKFTKFTIRINDRRILKAMAGFCGFHEEDYDTVFIILDKMDKIGMDGVEKELTEKGFPVDSVEKYRTLFQRVSKDVGGIHFLKEELKGYLDEKTAQDMEHITTSVESIKTGDFRIVFDPALVRGMSYYTGPIFEIDMDEFGGSVGGGGRYDNMVGNFTGSSTPACGFSIGFERIVLLLVERGYRIPDNGTKKAYLIDKNIATKQMQEILKQAGAERSNGVKINISIMKKNKKFQKEQLSAEGYTEIIEFYSE
ncbi:MAG: histidine--tRNA ligase [Lachnoclostridium sp.]|jgi:histidyl-tRNA synthetase|nr:histidine--tRNA ligase [Lachnoclostridium sp.]